MNLILKQTPYFSWKEISQIKPWFFSFSWSLNEIFVNKQQKGRIIYNNQIAIKQYV